MRARLESNLITDVPCEARNTQIHLHTRLRYTKWVCANRTDNTEGFMALWHEMLRAIYRVEVFYR